MVLDPAFFPAKKPVQPMGLLAVSWAPLLHTRYFRSPTRLESWIDGITLPPNSYVEVLISNTSECSLFWEEVLYRGNKVQMRSLGWAQIQYNWCLYKKNKFGHSDIYKEKMICRHREKMPSSSPGYRPESNLPLTRPRNPSISHLIMKCLDL